MIWVIYAYNVMFNLGTGMKNATHLKIFSMMLLSVGQHLSHWPTIKTLSPVRGKLLAELALKFSDVNIIFALLIFVIFLKNICISLSGISWAFQNIVKMLLNNIKLFFILS